MADVTPRPTKVRVKAAPKKKMFSAATIKRFTSVHSWVGIATGSILFIAFFAGALTMYVAPIHQWANPELRASSTAMKGLAELVAEVGADPGAAASGFQVSLTGAAPVASFYEDTEDGWVSHNRLFDAEGQLVNLSTASDVDRLVNEMHFTAGIPGTTGYIIMAIVSAVYFLALMTGLIIQLPKLIEDLYAFRPGKNLKKMWMDGHNAVGVVSLPFHLMFAITGVLLSCLFMLPDLYKYVTPTMAPIEAYEGGGGRRGGGRDEATPAPATMIEPARLIGTAALQLPKLAIEGISYSGYGTEDATATVSGRVHGGLASAGSVEMSAVTGEVTQIEAPGQRPTPATVEGGYHALHYGDFGGPLMRFMYFVLGLAGAFLFYSGNLLWIETKRKRRAFEQTRSSWMVAQMTIGVCLGACLGLACALAGSRLLGTALIEAGWERNLYYLGFFGAVIWSFGRPPLRGAIEVLAANAAAYAALPVINALTSPDNLVTSVIHGQWDLVLIDSIFLALAVMFGLSVRGTWRRGQNGQPYSVWAMDSGVEGRAVPAAAAPAPAE